MDHLFVSFSGSLKTPWRQAFASAQVVKNIADVDRRSDDKPAVLWLDVGHLPAADYLPRLQQALLLQCPVVVMSATPNDDDALKVMNHGAAGYCHVMAVATQLREVALVTVNGGFWLSPGVMKKLVTVSSGATGSRIDHGEGSEALSGLTARELAVALEVAKAATNREIAQRLNISERTVKAHLSVIFDKLALRDRVQLALAMHNIPVTS